MWECLHARMHACMHDACVGLLCTHVGVGGGGAGGCWGKDEGDPSRSYAVSAPADQDASQLYYSYRVVKGWGGGGGGGGKGGGGRGEGGRGGGGRGRWWVGGGGGGGGSAGERVRWVGRRS